MPLCPLRLPLSLLSPIYTTLRGATSKTAQVKLTHRQIKPLSPTVVSLYLCVRQNWMLYFTIYAYIFIYDIYVRVCHVFDIEICMCHQCEYFAFVFVFLCPLPAARVCKNVPHVLPKRGRVVDRDREREREGVRSCMGAWRLCLLLCLWSVPAWRLAADNPF